MLDRAKSHHVSAKGPVPLLSAKTMAIMELIAEGYSYDQILRAYPDMTYQDIFAAAEEVLRVGQGATPPADRLAQVRQRHPRAYEKWTPDEEVRLRELLQAGHTVAQIAGTLGRQRGAIRSRIIRLGWVPMLSPKEQARLARIEERERRRDTDDVGKGADDER